MRATFAIFMTTLTLGCGPPKSLAEEFPGEWQEPTGDVMRTLAQNGVKGCGEFYQKRAAEYSTEYMVACTRDGDTWTAWRVWTSSNDVLGPDPAAIWKLGGPPKRNSN
jgi:hypothetical protein